MSETRLVLALSAVVIVAFGSILYGFSVYVTEAAAGAEFSISTLSLGLTGAGVVNGALAPRLGRWMDDHGIRGVIAVGGVLAAVGMWAFAASTEPWHVVASWWLVLGPATAMVYYEPALVGIAAWVPAARQPRAFGWLTVLGGLAGAIFIPGTERLVAAFGWRPAVRIFGVAIAVVAVAVAATALPSGTPSRRTAAEPERIPIRTLWQDRRFRRFTLALLLTFGPIQGIVAHRVDRFSEAGFSLAVVSVWAGIASLVSLPGRFVAPLAAARWSPIGVTTLTIGVVAASVAVAAPAPNGLAMGAHFLLFGIAFGALTPLRAVVMTRWYGGPSYGAVSGAQWSIIAILAAFGPLALGAGRDASGDYTTPLVVSAWLVAWAVFLAWRSERVSAGSGSRRSGSPSTPAS